MRFFSRVCRTFRETIKKGCAKLAALVLRSFSYPIFAIPNGLASLNDKVEEIYGTRTVKVPLPKTIGNLLPCFTAEETIYGDGICEVLRATATGIGGNLLSSGALLTTYLQPLDGKPPHRHDIFHFSTKRFFPRIFQTSDEVITLAAGWQGAFYHWMYDVLPRLHLVEKKGLKGRLFIESKSSFQKESLKLLEIPEERLINIENYEAVKAPCLFIPSISAQPTPWGCQFLREKFILKLKKKQKKRIYVSRHDASRRRIANEKEVFSILSEQGFEKVLLSTLSLQEQMEAFYNAELVVAPHGAGLSHLVFCDPKTPVLEFFSPEYVNPCYWQISNRVDLSYCYLLGKKQPQDPNPKDPDIEIDLSELKQSLRLIGL